MLSEHEKHSSAWIKIEKELLKRIETYRKKNDNPLSETETAALRGKILELKSLLKLKGE